MNNIIDFFVFPSVNLEYVFEYNGNNLAEKQELTNDAIIIGGSSGNFAVAHKKLSQVNFGPTTKLIGFTGASKDYRYGILNSLLKEESILFKAIHILSSTSRALIPIDGSGLTIARGKKGEIDFSQTPKVIRFLKRLPKSWRSATGVRIAEFEFVEAFLGVRCFGMRTLNPKKELIKDREKFLKLLKVTDMLILNEDEFNACKVASPSDLHALGPQMVIVTRGRNGGVFSYDFGDKVALEYFDAAPCDAVEIYATGAGDWFHAALLLRIYELGLTIDTLDLASIRDALSFAALVSAKKILYRGGSSGPSREEIENF